MTSGIVDRSENQLSQTIVKAGCAAGIGYSQAEDIGKAAVLLCRQGMNGAEAALHSLNLGIGTAPSRPKYMNKTLYMTPASNRAAIDGVAAIDWLISQPSSAQLSVQACDSILMLAGLMLLAGKEFHVGFYIRFTKAEDVLLIVPDKALPVEGLEAARLPFTVHCVPLDKVSHDGGAKLPTYAGRCQVGADDWQALSALAHKNYVPATEASRMNGAGAGLVDND